MKEDGEKRVRVRYDDGVESGKERYILEKYDIDTGHWGTIMSTPFVASKEHPEVGREFIHFTLLIELLRWIELGYRV